MVIQLLSFNPCYISWENKFILHDNLAMIFCISNCWDFYLCRIITEQISYSKNTFCLLFLKDRGKVNCNSKRCRERHDSASPFHYLTIPTEKNVAFIFIQWGSVFSLLSLLAASVAFVNLTYRRYCAEKNHHITSCSSSTVVPAPHRRADSKIPSTSSKN